MATPSKRWPTNAEWARLDSVAAFGRIRRLINDASKLIDNPAALHRLQDASYMAMESELKLISVGPQAEKEKG